MTKRNSLIILILCGVTICLAGIITEKENIPQKVFDELYSELPENIPVVLDFNAGEFTSSLERLFKEQLIRDGYDLFEVKQDVCLILSMSYGYVASKQSSGFFLFRKKYLEKSHLFSYQVTKIPESQILEHESITLTTMKPEESSAMKWYDPLLISAIMGTLVYLFYFGSN